MRYLIATALAVAVVLTLRWGWTDRAEFEDELVHAALSEELHRGDSRCPFNSQAIDRAPLWLLQACASGGLDWHRAEALYGDDAAKVYGVYSQDQVFAAVFERLGHPVVPVIAYFVRHGSTQYRFQETVGRSLSRLWHDGDFSLSLAELTPEQYGLIAVHELADRGHELLSEFEIVGGVAVRKQFTRTVLGAKNILLGGVTDLELVLARGERLPTWGEVGWAAFDGFIVAGGIGVASKTLRTARAPITATGRGTVRIADLGLAGRGAARSLVTVGRAAGVAAVVAIPYVAITRPHLIASAGGWLAEQVGVPAWLGVFTAYALLCLLVATLLRIILSPFAWSIRMLLRLAMWGSGPLGGRFLQTSPSWYGSGKPFQALPVSTDGRRGAPRRPAI